MKRLENRVARLEPRVLDLQARLSEEQGRQLAAVISRSLDALRDRTLQLLEAEGSTDAADRIRQEWPGWVSRIVPAQIEAVTGARVAREAAQVQLQAQEFAALPPEVRHARMEELAVTALRRARALGDTDDD